MNGPKNLVALRQPEPPADDGRLIVTMTAAELRRLVRDEIKAALAEKSGTVAATELLRLSEAAKHLNQSKDWLYRHWKEVGGKKLGPKSIRFSVADLDKFVSKRGA